MVFILQKIIYVHFSCWTISAQRWRPIRRDRTLSVSSQTNQQKFPPDLNVVMQMGPAHHLVTGRLPQHDTSQFASKFHCPGSYREELERRSHHSRRLFTGQCNQNECLRHSRLWNRSRLWSSLSCSSCEHYKRNAGRFVSLKEIWIKIYQTILFIIKLNFFFNYLQPPPWTLSTNKHGGAIARNWFAVGHLGWIFARVKFTSIS